MHEDDARYLCIFVSRFLGSSSAAYRPFFIIVYIGVLLRIFDLLSFLLVTLKRKKPNYSSQEKVAFIYSLQGLVLFYSFEQRMALGANRRKPG